MGTFNLTCPFCEMSNLKRDLLYQLRGKGEQKSEMLPMNAVIQKCDKYTKEGIIRKYDKYPSCKMQDQEQEDLCPMHGPAKDRVHFADINNKKVSKFIVMIEEFPEARNISLF